VIYLVGALKSLWLRHIKYAPPFHRFRALSSSSRLDLSSMPPSCTAAATLELWHHGPCAGRRHPHGFTSACPLHIRSTPRRHSRRRSESPRWERAQHELTACVPRRGEPAHRRLTCPLGYRRWPPLSLTRACRVTRSALKETGPNDSGFRGERHRALLLFKTRAMRTVDP
jgi:hypothetical protein